MKQMKVEQIQPEVFEQFRQILSQKRLSHAYLFTGDFASYEMAIYVAKSIFCPNKVDGVPCDQCRSCRLIEANEFADVKQIAPVNQTISTDRIRDLVKEFSQSGVESQQQVFIIRQADKMHVNAANSLLKVIEEPQSEIYIFLLTSDESLILPTIRSRTQHFHFAKNRNLLVQELEVEHGLVKNQAEFLADFSQSLVEMRHLVNSTSFFELLVEAEKLTTMMLKKDSQALLQAARLSRMAEDKEKQEQVLKILELQFAKEMRTKAGQEGLRKLLLAKSMWKANVTFQNSLEFMLLK